MARITEVVTMVEEMTVVEGTSKYGQPISEGVSNSGWYMHGELLKFLRALFSTFCSGYCSLPPVAYEYNYFK